MRKGKTSDSIVRQKPLTIRQCMTMVTLGLSRSVWGKWFQQLEHIQVQIGTGPSVWKRKYSLLACHNHRKCSMETSRISVNVECGIKGIKLCKV